MSFIQLKTSVYWPKYCQWLVVKKVGECVSFFNAVDDYKTCPDAQRGQLAITIINTYLDETSDQSVNVDSPVTNGILVTLGNVQAPQAPPTTLFDPAIQFVENVLWCEFDLKQDQFLEWAGQQKQ